MIVEHSELFGLDNVFSHADLQPWFEDMTDTAMRVMVNRQCNRGDVVLSVCHGVYRPARLDWSPHQFLVAAAFKLREKDNTYLAMHSALDDSTVHEDIPLVVCLTSGRNNVITSYRDGIIALKHTSLPIEKIRKYLIWDDRLQCFKSNKARALSDYERHKGGLSSMLREAGFRSDLPDITEINSR